MYTGDRFGTHMSNTSSNYTSYNGGVLAIADGVSGYGTYVGLLIYPITFYDSKKNKKSSWAEQDVDPSLFPKELMANVSNLVGDEEVNDNPQILIGKAHAYTSSIGYATVIIAVLERNGTLKIANVGDCGLRVIREGPHLHKNTISTVHTNLVRRSLAKRTMMRWWKAG